MQWDRTADPAELSGTVRGLGVTDAFLLELQAVQRPLLEQQLRAMAKAIRIRIDQLGHAERLADTSYELQLIRMMQTRLATTPRGKTFEFIGPSGLVGELVHACFTTALSALAALINGESAAKPDPAAVDHAISAAGAWLATFVDLRSVVCFCFDPGADPSAAW
jgi:hypothetical protein